MCGAAFWRPSRLLILRGGCVQAKACMEEAKRRGLELDVWSYSTLIKGLCQAERSREAEEVLLAMKSQGVQPNVVNPPLVRMNCLLVHTSL